MNLVHEPRRGYAFLFDGGDIDELTRELNEGMIRHVPDPMQVQKVRGAVKAFSFHWSNAQAAWDVIPVRDFPWGLDGAEFILFMGKNAASPVGKSWSLAEMKYVAKKLRPHPGFTSSFEGGSARRVADQWLRQQMAAAAPPVLKADVAFQAAQATSTAVLKMLPGIARSLHQVTSKDWPKYSFDTLPNVAFHRRQIGETQFLGLFKAPEIAYQFGWDTARKVYYVSSFNVERKFTGPVPFWAFIQDPAKVGTLIKAGLKSIDAGEAAFFTGKVTPDSVINRVLEVKATFETVDEWHGTNLAILLMLRTSKPVPKKLVLAWLQAHWVDVQKLAPSKTPEPAGQPSRWASRDYDDDYDQDWKMDYPSPGLGWLVPNRLTFDQVEDFGFVQNGNRATVHAHASIR